MEHESDGDTSCGWDTWNNPQRIAKGMGKLGNKRISQDHKSRPSRQQNY